MPRYSSHDGGIHPDKQAWWVRVRLKPVLGPKHRNEGSFFVQLTADEAFGSFTQALIKAKREGKIIDFTVQCIERFWSAKEFEKKVIGRLKKK